MEVAISDLGGVTKAVVSGRMDTANVDKQEAFLTASVVPKNQHTIVDLTDVTFIASLGVRMLLNIARTLNRRGAKLIVYGAGPALTDVFETTALSELVPIAVTEEDALAAVAAA